MRVVGLADLLAGPNLGRVDRAVGEGQFDLARCDRLLDRAAADEDLVDAAALAGVLGRIGLEDHAVAAFDGRDEPDHDA